MSLEGLQARLSALQETTAQLRELIDRLGGIRFQPGSLPLSIEEEGSASGELSAEIGSILRGGLEDQQLLCEEIKYLRPEGHEKKRLEDGAERLGGELASCRSRLRKSRLSARSSLERAQRLERELTVQSFIEPVAELEPPVAGDDGDDDDGEALPHTTQRAPRATYGQSIQSSLSTEDRQTVGASNNVTEALRRTHALMASELTRSAFAQQMLTESSEALKSLDDSYVTLNGMLASSKDLLGTLLKSQKSDTWYLQTTLYMLMVTGAWLLFRRVLYGPLWWLVWLPLRMAFGIGSGVGSAVLQGRGGGGGGGDPGQISVGVDGNVPVQGLPDESLPTVQVGGETGRASDADETAHDSMVEKVGRIIDAANEADALGNLPEFEEDGGEGGEEGEGEGVVVEEVNGDSRPRDEL